MTAAAPHRSPSPIPDDRVNRRVQVILQARVGASRLPAKTLLPVGGMPLAVLAARRAANTGLPVRAAVSSAAADAPLARCLAAAGVGVWVGPQDDVLERFRLAAEDLPADALVVRITADNVFPDGGFLDEMIAGFGRRDRGYLRPSERLPYGLSAEVFTVAGLRQAARKAATPFDREHVTPWLCRAAGDAVFEPAGEWVAGLRCTVDCLADYLAVCRLFGDGEDAVALGWRELCARLAAAEGGRARVRRLCLGTAQLGIDGYGRCNRRGALGEEASAALLAAALSAGVVSFDTARAYGKAETRLGRYLRGHEGRVRVATKLDPLADLGAAAAAATVRVRVRESVFRSCRELRLSALPVLLLHRWDHFGAWGGAIWEELVGLQREGVVESLGASVYTVAEALAALREPLIRQVQVPVNYLDGRWDDPAWLKGRAARPDVAVAARSVLLQGLLAATPTAFPPAAGLNAEALVAHLERVAGESGCRSRQELAVRYVRALPWVDELVVGAENENQLTELAAFFQAEELPPATVDAMRAARPPVPAELLNPAGWQPAA